MLKFKTANIADWIVGERNDSTSDFRIYSYGTGLNALSIARATNAATFAGAATFGGTVTADGLTVDGSARIEEVGAIAKLTLERGGTANAADSAAVDLLETNAGSEGANFGDAGTNGFRLKLDGSANDFLIQSGTATTVRTRFGVDRDTGDISFYDDSNNAKFFWDASAESLGIGTTSNYLNRLYILSDATGSIPTHQLVQQNDANVITVKNGNNSATYSGIKLETRTSHSSAWLIANEWKSAYLGDLVFRARDGGGSTSQERLRIDSSGNVDLKTGGANLKLPYNSTESYSGNFGWRHVQLGNNGSNVLVAGNTATGGFFEFVTNNTVDLSTNNSGSHNGSIAMTIDSLGNVGIGTTPTVSYSAYSSFEIGAAGFITSVTGGNENIIIGSNAYLNTSGVWTYKTTNEASKYAQSAGVHYFSTAASGSSGSAVSFSDNMIIDTGGRVGIGTANASSYLATKLVLACVDEDGMTLAATSSGTKQNIYFADGTSGSARNRGNLSYDHADDSLSMGTASGSARFHMNSTGAVTKPSQPSFMAQRSGSQTGYDASSLTSDVIIFNVANSDVGSNYNTSNGLFTAPVDGIYWFQASVYAAVAFNQCWLVKNGSRAHYTDVVFYGNQSFVNWTGYIELDSGDTIGFHPYRASDTNVTVFANVYHTYFRGGLLN